MARSAWPVPRPMWRTDELYAAGWSPDALRWSVAVGQLERVCRGVYLERVAPVERREKMGRWVKERQAFEPSVSAIEEAIGQAVAAGGVVSGRVAATLLHVDGFLGFPGFRPVRLAGPELIVAPGAHNTRPGARRSALCDDDVVEVGGVRCTSPARTLVDLAVVLTALEWERALESVLRTGATVDEIDRAIARLVGRRGRGRDVIEAVLAVRPLDATPTGSLLETLYVQLIRPLQDLGPPHRQVEIRTPNGDFIAIVDLAWPDLGIFVELDGEQHEGQPDYDADRQTRVAGATGWLCGRFRWRLVVGNRRVALRRTAALVDQARRRPMAA